MAVLRSTAGGELQEQLPESARLLAVSKGIPPRR